MITVTRSDVPSLQKYIECLEKIWASRWLTNNGEFVKLLENRLEEYLKVKNLLLVANGTLALQLPLRLLGLESEVITTPFTFAATTNAILWERLTPVFADIDPETFNIDPKNVERKITDKTSAILAVHVYGNPCYVEELQAIAEKHNLQLIYDAAHAFGVEYDNQSVFNYGDISTLSFHATKVFSTVEGGAMIVKDDELYERMKLLRNHGIRSEEEVVHVGINAKMNELQAAMGLCNLDSINEKMQFRRGLYEHYRDKLENTGVQFQEIVASKYNYSYMPVCFEDGKKRDQVYSELIKHRIYSRKYFYPLTVNYDYFRAKGVNLVEKYNLRQAFDVSNRVLCLPLYPDLEIAIVDKIVSIIKSLLK
ncbi:MAG TPA: DegT/DnrJ/EryC1/StrS family aminotransferase [Sedimentisphaerales bacterium]|nr:DegT/DnrJ/EryC1/StrS family aminotransferase [Sedimentisphaerales bacterium]